MSRTSRSFGRVQSGPAAFGRNSLEEDQNVTSAQSKRRADCELLDSSKRAKPDVASNVANPAPCLFRNPASAASSRPSSKGNRRVPAVAKSFMSVQKSFASVTTASTSTNATSFTSTIFSGAGPPPGTDDTIEASSQELRRGTPPPRSSYVSAPSSTMEDALITSFNEHDRPLIPDAGPIPKEFSSTAPSASKYLHWPKYPDWLREAPFPIVWEVTRVALHCAVDLKGVKDLQYTEDWKVRERLYGILWQHPAFQGKAFPARPDHMAWDASLASNPAVLPHDAQVVYAASVDFTSNKTKPFRLTLQPVKLDDPHRLARKFGPDRFMELLIPSPDSSNLPNFIAKDDNFFADLIRWLSGTHAFCGRLWKPFYTKSGGSRKPIRDIQFGPDPRPVFKDRIYFFAESHENPRSMAWRADSLQIMARHKMLHWAFDFNQQKNRNQPVLKLFQRTALGKW